MKLKCISAHLPATGGIMGIGSKPIRPIDGLTLHKDYTGDAVAIPGYNSIDVTIYFLIYNDNNEWKTYDLNLFSPAER